MSAAEAVVRPANRLLPHNQVLVLLVAIAVIIAALGCGFVSLAPNRLVSGQQISLWHAAPPPVLLGLAAAGGLLLAAGFAPPTRMMNYLVAAVAGAALIAVLAAAGHAAAAVSREAPALARISLGAGFWVLFACAALVLIDALRRAEAGMWMKLLAAALIAAGVFALAAAGTFDALSLAREYATRREVFMAALIRHIVLVAAAVGPAVMIGAPLALMARRRPRFEAPLFAVLNLLQTVPSVALFGLLLVPLSGLASAVPALGRLGVGGVGPAPAVIALILYALLPVARSTLAGIAAVPGAAADAARGMGMTARQIFWQIEAPLALPVLLAGFRIVTVQTVGLTVVAALIGAGGLGSFVFEGLGQFAGDLVLLGALPAIVMALAADFLLRLLADAQRRRYAP